MLRRALIGAAVLVLAALTETGVAAPGDLKGAGTIVRADGVRGHFVVGTFDDTATCERSVQWLAERIRADARWFGQNLEVRVGACETAFAPRSLHRALSEEEPLGNVVLAHTNLRLVVVSPRGTAHETALCRRLADYVEHVIGGRARCTSTAPTRD